MNNEITLGVLMFTAVVLFLVAVILVARARLVSSGAVTISINNDPEKSITVAAGDKLLQTLSAQGIFLASACGGGGTCAQCRCVIKEGGGSMLATEESHFTMREAKDGWRLSCQVAVKQDMVIEVEEDVFGVKQWECTVESNPNVATFIKELTLRLPAGESVDFRAGGYVQLECPAHTIDYKTFDIEEEYRGDWDKFNVWQHKSVVDETTVRAYSMANYPEEQGVVKFNIRIASPPPGSSGIPAGKMSSYVFNLKPGDKMKVYGPFGEFFAKETEAEMVFIGGGAGMAPMRSLIFDQLKRLNSTRKTSFWYGARSMREAFYGDEYDTLAADNDNFEWHLALSDPQPEDNWDGLTGFIHNVLFENYLKDHEAPEDCEFYMCGPPMMNAAVVKMLQDLGVEDENIMLDDFGG
ncbi:NADH:ubiquinone reductase (Na(+)-transporting) subunit F [Oceanospirillaceae bacterium]|jgi:Na+-transporting NADH:ubiquinone oxidoreductase subunit F|uniref:NADH:ubiquinone reductase (Na(+)-transporting) subunit F n=1 Tax=Candidatus Njordibacter sp. Uisw_002 TaxID=3230971 RepID=UPI00233E205F|nr:NADH:ubiquinone reductase (Na(+)-transporting) subunit F [Oceanospirillaceae bacterium]MDB9958352.1 NADH:ubiquinone reductase (Na(+)-transporting) subunit F [Oceanospirillaceae bacterium]MDB9972573.1 NADH:ubiquinone reductase (Na(+)-transporting) subunit F [Oceanospirillaceae bacterium]MDC1341633.1 NADH:ubiquinone reductase (Na(+)-transporting) subunit F [Oceanospirillaceae bacterium]MDC1509328.1 NADH:ubiquinone reductase (Na(+)-transporting) subunit F [Oceanospirillaceae bacterium]|tara:strand:+ start:924 stop:2153 length:1230 start_codon:yes stop_codon:yes gene_type:complete